MMTLTDTNDLKPTTNKAAANAAMASLLNLTFLPAISFLWLILQRHKHAEGTLAAYHINFAIKLNLIAAFFLGVVTLLMIALGGFNSAWTWVYVISYFTLIHTVFIVFAVWSVTCAWSNKKVFKDKASK
ncbi:hypothetical protein [Thalassotalea sp. PLHSN55]|uniref:hypothetical protein n=1 Tax=Thalassotalea sp. PLHSN55 TaxID=3435888 RepID=UPI003F84FDB0